MHPPPLADLRAELDGVLDDRGGAHVERLTYCAAVLCPALESAGMRPALVGGAAIEFYLPDAYATSDLDFVVERATPDALDRVFTALGFRRTGRHWTRSDLFVEVPGLWIDEATREVPIGRHRLRVVTVEPLIGERIVGFRYWKVWAHGVQAVALPARTRGGVRRSGPPRVGPAGAGGERARSPARGGGGGGDRHRNGHGPALEPAFRTGGMMAGIDEVDWTPFREAWARRRARIEDLRARIDPRGMTKPARPPEERAWLEARGEAGPFTEVDVPGWRAWLAERRRRARDAAASPSPSPHDPDPDTP